MELGLKDRVAIVTGGSRGIGAASARALGAHGASVVVNYLSRNDKAEEVASHINAGGGRAVIFQADVRDRGAVDAMVEAAVSEFGRLDVLVNNANINFAMKPFAELSWKEMEDKLVGEMKAMFNCGQAAAGPMIKNGSGKLIFISSSLSRAAAPGFSAHAAAKAAMDSLARVMAMELGPSGIRVNVVGPGLTLTDATSGQPAEMHERIASFTPLRKIADPEDIAGAVLFLASSLSDHMTGQYLAVGGGSFMI